MALYNIKAYDIMSISCLTMIIRYVCPDNCDNMLFKGFSGMFKRIHHESPQSYQKPAANIKQGTSIRFEAEVGKTK